MRLKIVFTLTWLWGAPFPLLAQSVNPAWRDSSFTTSDGVRLRYRVGGQGRQVVFLPGWTMPAEIWEPQLRRLAGAYRVVALDPRSQGGSDRPPEGNHIERRAKDIDEFLQHLSGPPPLIVAWSLAVHEVLQCIQDHGTSRMAGLVLVDDYLWSTAESGRWAFYQASLERLLRNRRGHTSAFVRGMYRTPQDSAYLAWVTDVALSTPTPTAYTLLASAYTMGRLDWRPVLPQIDRPVLFVGTDAMKADAEAVHELVRGAEIAVFPGAGHALFVDEPERFNTLLETFAARVLR